MAKFVCAGLTTLDLAYYAAELPQRGMKGTATASYIDVGGPVANAAVTAVLLGSTAQVHSVFGGGVFSRQAKDILTGYGVAAVDHEPSIDLPVASVWIDGTGERTIISTDNKRSSVRAQTDLIAMTGVDAVLLDGHYPQLQLAMAETAHRAGVPIVLDCGRWRPVFAELLPVATDVIMTGTFRPPELDGAPVVETTVAIREEYGVALCAATRGPDPIVLATHSGVTEIMVPEVEVVDTTGAGDVLHGAYLHYRYGESLSGPESIRRSAQVASESCKALGARRLTDPK